MTRHTTTPAPGSQHPGPPPPRAAAPRPADLALLWAAIHHDQTLTDPARQALIQSAREQGPATGPADRRLVAWARQVQDTSPPVHQAADRARALEAWTLALAGGGGAALGVLGALAVFYYDGSARINVLAVLAVFVGLPLGTLALTLWAMFPAPVPLSGAWRALSAGSIIDAIVRRLPTPTRDRLGGIAGKAAAHNRLYAPVGKWALLTGSQVFAVALSAAAIATALGLVVFSDLAFGWSTTLNISPQQVHRLTGTLAGPWSRWTDAADPTLGLITESRYFRLRGATPPPTDAGQLGAWWPFVVLAMTVYGLVPRVGLLLLCRWRRQRAIRAALAQTPGAAALLRRLDRPALGTVAEAAGPPPGPAPGPAPHPGIHRADLDHIGLLIAWADAPIPAAPAPPLAADRRQAAGGARSIDQDRTLLERIGAMGDKPATAVLVKAWEPPVLEVLDFLRDLRRVLGDGVELAVWPVGDALPAQRAAWSGRLATLGDPWLTVAAGPAQPGGGA